MINRNEVEGVPDGTEDIDQLANEVEALICDWNRPSQLQDSVPSTALKIAKWHQNLLQEAKLGWEIQLPDLPYFQIKAYDGLNENLPSWISPLYGTRELPAVLSSAVPKSAPPTKPLNK